MSDFVTKQLSKSSSANVLHCSAEYKRQMLGIETIISRMMMSILLEIVFCFYHTGVSPHFTGVPSLCIHEPVLMVTFDMKQTQIYLFFVFNVQLGKICYSAAWALPQLLTGSICSFFSVYISIDPIKSENRGPLWSIFFYHNNVMVGRTRR